MKLAIRAIVLIVTSSVLAGCLGNGANTSDGGTDAGAIVDTGIFDSGTADGGEPDAGSASDAGTVNPYCTDKECGDDGHGGSCGQCVYGQECSAEQKCVVCTPMCTGKACGDDAGCGLKCKGPCADPKDECVGGPGWMCMPLGCQPRCTGKVCGDADGCGGKCFAPCSDGTTTYCRHDPDWACDCIPDCINKNCGDDDACGGKCYGWCPNSEENCDQLTFTCTYQCPKACGETSGSYLCIGPCPNAGEECRLSPDGNSLSCVACNQTGGDVGVSCSTRDDCKCGNDCAILFANQTSGECLADCLLTGKCAATTDVCIGFGDNGAGGATGGTCFPTGRLTGEIAGAAVLDDCQATPVQTDIGTGTLSLTLGGSSATFTQHIACHYMDGTTTPPTDVVQIMSFQVCGINYCPDIMFTVVETSAMNVGTVQAKDGVYAQYYQITCSGQTASDVWIRGLGFNSGSVNITAASTGGKASFSAKDISLDMIKYDWESCGGGTGVVCTNWTPPLFPDP